MARFTKPTVKRMDLRVWGPQFAALALVYLLVFWTAFHFFPPGLRLWARNPWLENTGALLSLAGVLWAIWARVRLGKNWSGKPAVKQNHELIVSGPYAITRHPIYTGVLAAAVGTALALGQLRGVLFAVALLFALCFKLHLEEQMMMEAFPDAYPAYRRRVRALIPWIF
jgi:protein-S-isoprenylcysteine O-methyltransferase Ste14